MLEPNSDSPWWDILKTVSNIVAMGLAVGFGWLTKKFTSTEMAMKAMADRIDDVERDLIERTQAAATNIAVLKSYHESNLKRLDSIDKTAQRVEDKLDALIIGMAAK